MRRSTMFILCFAKLLLPWRAPVWGTMIGVRLTYFTRPGSLTTISRRSYFSKSRRLGPVYAGFCGARMAATSPPSAGCASSVAGVMFVCSSSPMGSPHRLLFLALDELVEGHVVHLDDLEADARDVAVRAAHAAADALDEDLVVLVDEVDRAVAGGERRDLAAVLDELDLDGLADGRVGLLGLDPDLLDHDAAGLRHALDRVRLFLEPEGPGLVVPVGPAELLPVVLELARREESLRHAGRASAGGLFEPLPPEGACAELRERRRP